VAALIKAEPREILFTSGGTESINTALNSALATQPQKRHVVMTTVEHSAALKFSAGLQKSGYEITFLPVSSEGTLDLQQLEKAIRADTAIVSILWANNETGVLFPLEEIAHICRERKVLLHTDAVQMAGKLPLDLSRVRVDLLSLSAHKLNAPKGIGALFVRRHTRFQPYLLGGGQESGRRGGTENVPSIIGFGRAAELALSRLQSQPTRIRALRDRLESGLLSSIPQCQRNGAAEPRLPNTSNLAFSGVEAEGILLLAEQQGICLSSGSACTSGSLDPSHVILAMGCSVARARASVRLSLGPENTDEEVDYVLGVMPALISKLRKIAAG